MRLRTLIAGTAGAAAVAGGVAFLAGGSPPLTAAQEYALVGPRGEIAAVRSDVRPDVPMKAGWRWLPVETEAVPIHDAAMEVVEAPVLTVEKDKVVRAQAVRDKRAEEIEAETDGAIEAYGDFEVEIWRDFENRLRALEGGKPVSVDEYRAILKERL